MCCAIPYLLGFHPTDSAVLLWMAETEVVLTQRVDLPPVGFDPATWASAVGAHSVAGTTNSVIAVLYADGDAARDEDRLRELAHALADQGWAERTDVVRALPDSWFNLLCGDPGCCPPEGQAIDPALRNAVAAEFAGVGVAPMVSRDALAAALGPDALLVEQIVETGLLAGDRGHARPDRRREKWRDEMIAAVMAWIRDRAAAPDPHRLATLLLALRDIRVRDTVLWELSRLRHRRLVGAAEQLTRLLRAAPEGDVAAIATCACVCHWLLGDGTRAGVAVQRALDDAPEYVLAQVFDAALQRGLPPHTWRDAMRSLTREECRGATRAQDVAC